MPNVSEYHGSIFIKLTDLVGLRVGDNLAFDNGFNDREAAFKRLNCNNPAINSVQT